MKVFIVNTNSLQLKSDALALQRDNFDVLISNSLERSERIISEKKPQILILYLSAGESERYNSLLSSLKRFDGLVLVIFKDKIECEIWKREQCEFKCFNYSDISIEELIKICVTYRRKANEEIESSKDSIGESIRRSMSLSHLNDLSYTKSNVYDYQKIVHLLKNDKVKIVRSLNEFLNILSKSKQLTEQALETNEFEILREAFHDVLNLAEYYGAFLLSEFVSEFKRETKFSKKSQLLLLIEIEQKKVFDYYFELEQDFSSTRQLKR